MERLADQDTKNDIAKIKNEFSREQIYNILKNARALDDLGQFEEAILWYDLAISKNPKDPFTWYDKGNVYDNMGKYQEAISSYDKVLEMKPNDTSAMYNKATVLARIGKYEEAFVYYDKVILNDPTHVGALHNRRIIMNKLGIHFGITPMKKKQII